MLGLNLQAVLRHTTTILQLVDNSTVSKEVLVDIYVSIDTWEYLAGFIVL